MKNLKKLLELKKTNYDSLKANFISYWRPGKTYADYIYFGDIKEGHEIISFFPSTWTYQVDYRIY